MTCEEIGTTRARALAARQHGVISWAQLAAAGVAASTSKDWIKRGTLVRLVPRVYALGDHVLTVERELFKAVLFAGPGAMLSHTTAAWRYGLLDHRPRNLVQVSTPRHIASVRGIRVFGRRDLTRELHLGLPVTTIPQTLLDLAASSNERVVRRALAQLDYRHRLDVATLEAVCGRRRPGSAALRRALREHQPRLAYANEGLEEDFLVWCERFHVPLPRVNVRVHGVLVDAYWPAHRFVVELDGLDNHSSPAQLRRDKRNELTLREHGLTVVRYDWELLHREPKRVHADLTAHLDRLLSAKVQGAAPLLTTIGDG
jgi:very-short-patch-repair endonuclease